MRSGLVRSGLGLALAALLLLAGSFSSLILDSSITSGLSFGSSEYVEGWRMFGTLDRLPGGIGLVGLGPLAVVGAALLLARRDRLVLALAAGTGLLLLATALLTYEPFPYDQVRLERHARNFALFALLIALGVRLAALRPAPWRYGAGATIVALIIWPTIVAPVRNLGLAMGNGVEVANAQPAQTASRMGFEQRFVLEHVPSDRITAYIRSNTAIDARVFSPHPHQMTYATGRPNTSGFAGLLHLEPKEGPEYRDVLGYLEPAAVRRLGFEYVHAPDSWVESLPDEAAARLNDPPPLRASHPRRFREPLPRAARVSHARPAARARDHTRRCGGPFRRLRRYSCPRYPSRRPRLAPHSRCYRLELFALCD